MNVPFGGLGYCHLSFPEKEFLENMVLNEDREVYSAMTVDQKRLVRFGYYWGITHGVKHE